jgi:hypothetical protein
MNAPSAPDLLHAFTKLQALRRLNHSRSRAYEQALDEALTKLAAWHDAEPDSEEEAAAFAIFLAMPLPPAAYQ